MLLLLLSPFSRYTGAVQYFRKVCIIAHIDHAKSTLAGPLIQRCGDIAHRDLHYD
ncbi:GTP-binding protein [Aeoliella sp. SH292]|uniref:GTP-binding protein n=1 Tax=Aeoliella sp. SH292 TaxID=3454464 RepID=UPI003F987C18